MSALTRDQSAMHSKKPFEMDFDISTIKHLGLQMYSTLPPVIGELIANAWDANAKRVEIAIPEAAIRDDDTEIVISDDGLGMSDSDIRDKYLIVGRDRREAESCEASPSPFCRKIMGRKGIGKFSAFGIAREIEIESIRNGDHSRFIMDYDKMLEAANDRRASFEPLPPTDQVLTGTRIALRKLTKFRTRGVAVDALRRGLARRFSVIAAKTDFEVVVNARTITVEERDLRRLLDVDMAGRQFLWSYDHEEIEPETGWKVSGWIGALKGTTRSGDRVDRGVSVMARGKLVQEPFWFKAEVGQQFALSYLVGELHAEFVDADDDTIGTSRNTLVWDAEPNQRLMEWGQKQMKKIAREWAERRRRDQERRLEDSEHYRQFKHRAAERADRRAFKLADRLIRETIRRNPTAEAKAVAPVIDMAVDFVEFDSFSEIAQDLLASDWSDIGRLIDLFREWEVVEAMEMARVTKGRIETIRALDGLLATNALEVPTLHQFLKKFPWVIDPRWTLVEDEVSYSKLLREKYPDSAELPERDRRIDFLCVSEGTNLVVVEIKRPQARASERALDQIEQYVNFSRTLIHGASDREVGYVNVVGYLLCGDVVDSAMVRERMANLERSQIYVRRYGDLLGMVSRLHKVFLERYEDLKRTPDRQSTKEGE